MTPDRPFREQERTTVSPLDLQQIKAALGELRASSPKSVLADLVEEKIRAIEDGSSTPRLASPPARVRQILS